MNAFFTFEMNFIFHNHNLIYLKGGFQVTKIIKPNWPLAESIQPLVVDDMGKISSKSMIQIKF